MDKQTAIETLKRLASLISAKKELEGPVLDDIDRQTTSNLRSIRDKFFDQRGILHPQLARYSLKNVIKNKEPESSTNSGCLYCAIGFLAVTICFLPQIIGWTAYLILLTAIVVFLLRIKFAPTKSEPQHKIDVTIKGEQAEEYKKVQESLKCYEQEVQRGVQQLAERKAMYPKAFAECLQEIKRAETRKNDICHKIIAYDNEIAAINLITPKHYHLINSIIDLLETGCADSCKEALNMAISQEAEQQHRETLEKIKREELEREKEVQKKQDQINDLLKEELLWQRHDRFYKK